MISRRELLAGALLAPVARAFGGWRPKGLLIEPHIHLFSDDPARFPYAPDAPYKPPAYPLEEFVKFTQEENIEHAVIVHPEPYQDDHRYTEYCVDHEPSKGFFKFTCLFDPIDPKTPARMKELANRHPGRLVALRIHEVHKAGTPSTTSGPIKDRDMHSPQMLATWRATHEMGLFIQMHFIPHYASQIGELAAKFPQMPVILDHLARPNDGTPAEYDNVIALAKLPHVIMKWSNTGVQDASHQPYPHLDAKPLVKRVYEAFGPDRIIWGSFGGNAENFEKVGKMLDILFDYAPESEREKIRGLNSKKLFGFA